MNKKLILDSKHTCAANDAIIKKTNIPGADWISFVLSYVF